MPSKKSAYEPSGPSGRTFSQFPWHEATRSISTPPWMGCQSIAGLPPPFCRSTHLYTWVERGTVGVKCLAQEHNTMFPARTRTRTIHSRVEHTNHEATAPPCRVTWINCKMITVTGNNSFRQRSHSCHHWHPCFKVPILGGVAIIVFAF